MTKGRDYYIYMFIDEQMAFASVFKNLLVVLLLYIFVVASVFAFRRRSNAQLLKIQMMQEEAYKQKLLQEAQRADMANNAKTEFLQRMSHDIRTPINGIRGMIEVADYYKDDLKKQDECRRKIWDETISGSGPCGCRHPFRKWTISCTNACIFLFQVRFGSFFMLAFRYRSTWARHS